MSAIAPRHAGLHGVAWASIFVFGIVMALLGAVLPSITPRIGLSLGDIGRLFLVMNSAMMAASLVLGLVVDRAGLKLPMAAGALLVAVGVWLVPRATDLPSLLLAVTSLGFGGGALNGGANTLVADLHDDPQRKASALNVLGVFFGIGALVLPFSLGALESRYGMGALLSAAALLCVATAAVAAGLRFPAPKQAQGWPLANMPGLLRDPFVLAIGLLLFFQSGNEFAMGGYVSSLLARDFGLAIDTTSYVLAAYWAALMGARLVIARVSLVVGPHALVGACAGGAALGALVVAAAPSAPVAIAGALLTAAALSGVFPTALGIAGARFAERSGTVFGVLFTIALAGGITVPWLSGLLAEATSLRWVFVVVAVNFCAIVVLNLAARRAAK
jgi:fucose permease